MLLLSPSSAASVRAGNFRRHREECERGITGGCEKGSEASYNGYREEPDSPFLSFRTPPWSPTSLPHRLALWDFEYFQAVELHDDIDPLHRCDVWLPKSFAGMVDQIFEEFPLNIAIEF